MTLSKTISYAKSNIGRSEVGSTNRVYVWDHIRSHYGANYNGSPWCGGFVLDCAIHGGLKLPLQMVSVLYVEDWAKRKGRWGTKPENIKAGDLVVLGGHGVHVELAIANGTKSGVTCIGGNTSGGKVAKNFRRASNIHGFAKISNMYPKTPAFAPSKFPLKTGHFFGKKLQFKPGVRKYIHNGNATFADQNNTLKIQKWLKELGYYKGPLSGTANLSLHRAVVAYQKKLKYKNPNGAVGGGATGRGGTWKALQQSVYNKRYK